MSYKILTKNGIDNSNIDGARGEYFNSGMRDGIVQGVLNEGLFTATASNVISLDTCELRIAGHRIVIDAPVYHTFSNIPENDTRYAYVAQIIVDDNQNVDFSLFVQTASTPLTQNDLYKNITGAGTYQVEIGRFTLLNTLKIVDVVKTIDTITGASGVNGDYIRIGEVTTTMLDAGFDAEVDVENVTNQTTGLKETNFNFSIPKTAGSVVNVGGEQVASVNFTSDPQTQLNNKINQDDIDTELSDTSENVVQNKVITNAINTKPTININNIPQSEINFDSDPQVQLDDLKNIFITLTENSGTLTQEQFNILNNNPNSYIVYANRTYYRQFAGNPYQFICINMLNNLMTQYVYGFYTLTINDNDLSYSTDSQLLVSPEGLNGFVYLLDTQSNQTITGEKNFTNLKLNNNTPLGIVDSGSIGSSETDFYIRLDNNIQICFGYRNRVGNNTLITVQPYRDAEYSVQVTQRGDNSSWSDNMKARNLTTTSFNVNTGGDTGYCWLCIGYWQ